MTKIDPDQALALWNAGLTVVEIGRKLGKFSTSVTTALKARGVTDTKRARKTLTMRARVLAQIDKGGTAYEVANALGTTVRYVDELWRSERRERRHAAR